jgi:hypothetical protein
MIIVCRFLHWRTRRKKETEEKHERKKELIFVFSHLFPFNLYLSVVLQRTFILAGQNEKSIFLIETAASSQWKCRRMPDENFTHGPDRPAWITDVVLSQPAARP